MDRPGRRPPEADVVVTIGADSMGTDSIASIDMADGVPRGHDVERACCEANSSTAWDVAGVHTWPPVGALTHFACAPFVERACSTVTPASAALRAGSGAPMARDQVDTAWPAAVGGRGAALPDGGAASGPYPPSGARTWSSLFHSNRSDTSGTSVHVTGTDAPPTRR